MSEIQTAKIQTQGSTVFRQIWSFKLNASCLNAVNVLVPVWFGKLEFGFQTMYQNPNVWKLNAT